MDLGKMLTKWGEAGIELLFPRRCPICDDVLPYHGRLVCRLCAEKLKYLCEPLCMKCGKRLREEEEEYCFDCSRRTHYFIKGLALYEYNCVKDSIYRFKYQGRAEYAKFYGEEMKRVMGERILEWKPEALIPVPIHYRRRNKRGYNQSEVLAQQISKQLHIPVKKDIVKRVKNTLPQKELDSAGRQNNLKRAFNICRNDVKLSTVIIVDDIYTTGNTIDAIACELQKSGISNIYYIALAIGYGL